MGRRRIAVAVAGAVVAAIAFAEGLALGRPATPVRPDRVAPITSRYALAGRCVAVGSMPGAPRFYFKATGLGTYMLYRREAKLLGARRHRLVEIATAGPATEWTAEARGAQLTLRRVGGPVVGKLAPASGCKRFPEARVDATGQTFKGTDGHGRVFGFVDDHLHITANMRGGGLLISGEPFDRFGIPSALGRDAKVHGANGALDITGNLLRSGTPVGTHDTHGWPTFRGWPTFDTQTHQQTYYVWLQRAWEAGERLVVAQTVDDSALCRVEPRKVNRSCDETKSIVAQIHTLRQMQNYIAAQSGGPGRGWFRLVYTPAQARRVIAQGKLAVIIGIESSDPFGCSELRGQPQCTRADIVRRIRDYKRLGVRGMFVAHWFNNALSGAALEEGDKGILINLLNRFQTGSYFKTGACPGQDRGVPVMSLPTSVLVALSKFFPATKKIAAQGMPAYPSGLQCNPRGLTALGRFAIEQLMKAHMLIEVDHLSQNARDAVLSMAVRAQFPLVSSHNGTGGEWSPAELVKLFKLGGFAAVTPTEAPRLAAKILKMATYRDRSHYFGVGIGTDTGGLSTLPGPGADAAQHPLRYPFKSYDGKVTFTREVTGTRTFDLNTDGVAHYGLMADLLADMQQQPGGRQALALLFRSAEAYLETWQRAFSNR